MSVSTDLKFDAARDMEDVGADDIPIAPKVTSAWTACQESCEWSCQALTAASRGPLVQVQLMLICQLSKCPDMQTGSSDAAPLCHVQAYRAHELTCSAAPTTTAPACKLACITSNPLRPLLDSHQNDEPHLTHTKIMGCRATRPSPRAP